MLSLSCGIGAFFIGIFTGSGILELGFEGVRLRKGFEENKCGIFSLDFSWWLLASSI